MHTSTQQVKGVASISGSWRVLPPGRGNRVLVVDMNTSNEDLDNKLHVFSDQTKGARINELSSGGKQRPNVVASTGREALCAYLARWTSGIGIGARIHRCSGGDAMDAVAAEQRIASVAKSLSHQLRTEPRIVLLPIAAAREADDRAQVIRLPDLRARL